MSRPTGQVASVENGIPKDNDVNDCGYNATCANNRAVEKGGKWESALIRVY